MVKIEKLSQTCIATINGSMIAVGQLYTLIEFRSMVVQSGSVTVSIDEKEIVTVDAITLPEPDKPTLVDELENMDKILGVESKNTESLLAPVTRVTVPKAKITKPAK